jgi:hypothetical protein
MHDVQRGGRKTGDLSTNLTHNLELEQDEEVRVLLLGEGGQTKKKKETTNKSEAVADG